jgi:hypothetical protein
MQFNPQYQKKVRFSNNIIRRDKFKKINSNWERTNVDNKSYDAPLQNTVYKKDSKKLNYIPLEFSKPDIYILEESIMESIKLSEDAYVTPFSKRDRIRIPNEGYYLFLNNVTSSSVDFMGIINSFRNLYNEKFIFVDHSEYGMISITFTKKNINFYVIYDSIKWFMNIEMIQIDNLLSSKIYVNSINDIISIIQKFIHWCLYKELYFK